jgi:hypothetical protein
MSHGTDGELHAYLDGALGSIDPVRADRLKIHLEGCSDCTTRLEDARVLRARAGEILADAQPEFVEIPPFEAILERRAKGAVSSGTDAPGAGDGSTPIPFRRSRPPLAWAASVAVALGAGWLGHALLSGTRVGDMAGSPMAQAPAVTGARGPESAEAPTPAANFGLVEGEVGDVASEAQELAAAGSLDRLTVTERSDDAPGTSGRQADPREQDHLENRAVEPADELDEDAARVSVSELVAVVPTGVARGGGERENQPPPARPAPDAAERRAEQPAEQPAEEPQPSPEAAQARERRAAEAGEGNETLRNVQKAAQDAEAAQDAQIELAETGVDARDEEARRRFADARGEYFRDELTLDARLVGGQLSWLPVSRAHAEHWIGGPVLDVPGLAPATLAISTLGEARLVRAVQTLPGGETLELIQEALATDEAVQLREAPGAAPAAPPGFEADFARAPGSRLVIERDGFRITAHAQVAVDSLRILLSRLR